MDLYLNNTPLPLYNSFEEMPAANVAKNVTLDGQLHVDILNNRRSWKITWNNMKANDYATVRAFYDSQFSSGTGNFTRFYSTNPQFPLSVFVYINISNRKMILNKTLVEVTELILEEQYAVS